MEACLKLGLRMTDLFHTNDLYEERDVMLVRAGQTHKTRVGHRL